MNGSETTRKEMARRSFLGLGTASSLGTWSALAGSDSTPSRTTDEAPADSLIDLRSLGARGDGNSDDTSAIQRALDRGGRILVPPGTYKITAELKLRASGTVLQGTSAGNTRIVSEFNGASLISNAHKDSTLLWCRLLDLAFVDSGRVASIVDWRSMQFGEVSRCIIYGSGSEDQTGINCGVMRYGAQECTFNRFQDNYLGNLFHGYRATDGANANHICGGRAQLKMTGSAGAWFQSKVPNGVNGWTIEGFCCEYPGNNMIGLGFGGNVWDMYVAGCRFEQLRTAILINPGNKRISVIANAYSSNFRDIMNNGRIEDRNMIIEASEGLPHGDIGSTARGVFDGRDATSTYIRGAAVRKSGAGSYLITLEPRMPSETYGVLVSSDRPATKYQVLSPDQFLITTLSNVGRPEDAGPGVTFSVIF